MGLLEYPHYTRPAAYRGWEVPEVLLSGNHREIEAWRRREALLRTRKRRPDLLKERALTIEEKRWLDMFIDP
jgi:tRNA (guanine37-N1)-methyltransferase